jgi:hypothetical protein
VRLDVIHIDGATAHWLTSAELFRVDRAILIIEMSDMIGMLAQVIRDTAIRQSMPIIWGQDEESGLTGMALLCATTIHTMCYRNNPGSDKC